jgi:hypothetical protein
MCGGVHEDTGVDNSSTQQQQQLELELGHNIV